MVNGYDDLLVTMDYFFPFENSYISIGQHKSQHPFVGRLENMELFLYPINDLEIKRMILSEGLKPKLPIDNFTNNGIRTYQETSIKHQNNPEDKKSFNPSKYNGFSRTDFQEEKLE